MKGPYAAAPRPDVSSYVADSGGPEPGAPLSTQVHLIRGDRLQRATRPVPPGDGIAPVLRALTAPLNQVELADGLRTAVPATTHPLAATVTHAGTAELAVPPGFDRLSVREQQAVRHGTARLHRHRGRAGERRAARQRNRVVAVPDAQGQLAVQPVSRHDYADLAPVR